MSLYSLIVFQVRAKSHVLSPPILRFNVHSYPSISQGFVSLDGSLLSFNAVHLLFLSMLSAFQIFWRGFKSQFPSVLALCAWKDCLNLVKGCLWRILLRGNSQQDPCSKLQSISIIPPQFLVIFTQDLIRIFGNLWEGRLLRVVSFGCSWGIVLRCMSLASWWLLKYFHCWRVLPIKWQYRVLL